MHPSAAFALTRSPAQCHLPESLSRHSATMAFASLTSSVLSPMPISSGLHHMIRASDGLCQSCDHPQTGSWCTDELRSSEPMLCAWMYHGYTHAGGQQSKHSHSRKTASREHAAACVSELARCTGRLTLECQRNEPDLWHAVQSKRAQHRSLCVRRTFESRPCARAQPAGGPAGPAPRSCACPATFSG